MSSGFKKGTQIYYPFLSKIPANNPPPGSPTGPLWREIPVHRAFYISLENLIKIPLNRKALRKERTSMFPKSGPLWKQTPIPEPYLTYLSRSPVKDPPSRPPSWNPSQRDAPFLEPSFIHLSKSQVYKPPPNSTFPSGAPLERNSRHQSLLQYNFQGPQ